MPQPCPGLGCWTPCKQLTSCPEGKWRKGSIAKLKEKARPVLGHSEVSIRPPVPKRHKALSPRCRPPPKILLDLPPSFTAPFLARGTPLSASSLHFVKPPVAPIVLLIPVPALKHDCRVAVISPPIWLGCLSQEDATNMWWDWASTHTGTLEQVLPMGV